ncbi:hypothetical protein ACFTAO_24485 [Paenibacillus rhizoplanae]
MLFHVRVGQLTDHFVIGRCGIGVDVLEGKRYFLSLGASVAAALPLPVAAFGAAVSLALELALLFEFPHAARLTAISAANATVAVCFIFFY